MSRLPWQNTFALADAESCSFGFLASLNHLQQLAMDAAPCSVLVSIMAVRVAFLTFAYEQEALAVRLNTNLIVKIHVCAEKISSHDSFQNFIAHHHPAMVSLGHLGRKHYVSQSALSAVLAEVKAMETSLPKNVGRKALKRARQEQCDTSTPVGDMFLIVRLQTKNQKGDAIDLKILNPVAWLYHIATMDGFGEFFEKEVTTAVPTASAPWELCVYSDEVTPGNQLKSENRRRFHAFYFSFKNLKQRGLTDERTWFTLCCIRSHLVEKVQDGLSGVTASLLQAFYTQPHDLRQGVLFRLHSGRRMVFFAKATLLVADESALKNMLAIKGASGTVPCV